MNALRGILFDYGGTMTNPVSESITVWMNEDGIVPGSFTRTLRAWLGADAPPGSPIHLLELGRLDVNEFNALLAAQLQTHDGEPAASKGILRRMFAGMRPDPAMFQLVADLRAAGVRVGLLSNSWGSSYPRDQIDAAFDAVVISGEVGMRKPESEIYLHALERLGLPADVVAFVDDAEANLRGARAVGLRTHLHTDAATTRRALAAWLPALTHAEES